MEDSKIIRYLNVNATDEKWGIVVTTIGYQQIPCHSRYPLPQHPAAYTFNPQSGRRLNEYQLVYISRGEGYFESEKCRKTLVKAGTMILLYPGEWHSYYPNEEKGWYEYWVGFKGEHIDNRIRNGFFHKEKSIFEVGLDHSIINLYEDIANFAKQEKTGYQQLISSIVLYILGYVYYKDKNISFTDSLAIEKINEARSLMKKNLESPLAGEAIAEKLNVSYSWFRRMFKSYTGVSPGQYQAQLRFIRSKELLSTTHLSISEIAYSLNFENVGQFSTFFHKKEGISPTQFREITKPDK